MPQKIIISKAGGYEQLKLNEFILPKIQPNEVSVEVKAIGVNYADVCVRLGVYESAKQYVGWPITPGFEFAGIINEVGASVTRWKKGDNVFGVTRFDAYSSDIVLSENQIFTLPHRWTFEQAAAFPSVFITAYHALFQIVRIRPQGKLLIHSAAGGVGTALLQIAKLHGFESVGVVGSTAKIKTAFDFGATHVIDKSKEDLWAKASSLAPSGYDAIFDANGPETLRKSFDHLAQTGKLLIYGAHSMIPKQGGKLNFFKLIKGWFAMPRFAPFDLVSTNRSVIGFNVSFLFDRHDLMDECFTQLLSWIKEQKIKPPTITTFSLKDVAEAHKKIESGTSVGKLVLIP